MPTTPQRISTHRPWVKITHWIGTLGFLFALFSGVEILMVHPRLYWGETGNDLTPALFELPISRNYKHGGWEKSMAFFDTPGSPVSAGRTYDIFNQNGWGRSLHFLSGWILVITGFVYLLFGLFTGHFRRSIFPRRSELSWRNIVQDARLHLQQDGIKHSGGPQYGLLQKTSYTKVLFLLVPLMVFSGLTMSPTVTRALPFLLDVFGGFQSARTIHFFTTLLLVLFLVVHVVMVIRTGFRQQMASMTYTRKDEKA